MKRILILAVAIAAFTSCQKVIDVNLNEANTTTIIEANYSAEDSTVHVYITETTNFFSNDAPPPVNSAVVTITDHLGNSTSVPFSANGEYILTNYIPTFDTEYTLTVDYNGVVHEAKSMLKTPIQQDPLTSLFIEEGFFGSSGGYVMVLSYQDPAAEGDFGSAILTKNGNELEKLDQLTLIDDKLTNGNFVQRPLFTKFFDQFDTVGVELRTIDERMYDYYTELQSLSNPNSAAPANPEYQWTNKALGYFSAHSSSRQELIIQ